MPKFGMEKINDENKDGQIFYRILWATTIGPVKGRETLSDMMQNNEIYIKLHFAII